MEGDMELEIENGTGINIRLIDAKCVDPHTFNVSSIYSESIDWCFPFPATLRYYNDIELARDVHRMSTMVDHPSVARSHRILDKGTLQAKIIFQRFHKYSFIQWLGTSPNDDEARKTFRSIVYGIDLMHHNHHSGLDLLKCIRVDEHGNAHIVLNSKQQDDMEDGIYEDMKAFDNLVVRVFRTRGSYSEGYQLFRPLCRYLCGNRHKFPLRVLSYYVFHNPLFYEVDDRSDFMRKLLMFEAMDKNHFRRIFFSKPQPMPLSGYWWKKTNIGISDPAIDLIERRGNERPDQYKTGKDFLLLYLRCLGHGQDTHTGLLEVQHGFDTAFPKAIYLYFDRFVRNIAKNIVYKDFEVLQYMRNVPPASSFLRSAA